MAQFKLGQRVATKNLQTGQVDTGTVIGLVRFQYPSGAVSWDPQVRFDNGGHTSGRDFDTMYLDCLWAL